MTDRYQEAATADVIVLAYDGSFDIGVAIEVLRATGATRVVTVTVDVGQTRDVAAVRDHALAHGAARAHVFDAVDEFARECVLPVLRRPAGDAAATPTLALPVVARRVLEAARLEGTTTVAVGAAALAEAIAVESPATTVVVLPPTPARQPLGAKHLLQRPVANPVRVAAPARLAIHFEDGMPVALNGVPLSLPELIESVSLIAGQHGVGAAEGSPAGRGTRTGEAMPAAIVLQAAFAALGQPSGVIAFELRDGGTHMLSAPPPHSSELVTHA